MDYINLKIILLIVSLQYSKIYSQEQPTISEYIETTSPKGYFAPAHFGGDMQGLIFEANVGTNIHIPLYDSSRFGIQVSPAVTLRMLNQHSFPVANPSFIVKAQAFYRLNNNNSKSEKLIQFNITHHSNGQDKHFLIKNPSTGLLGFNLENGSFTTHFLDLGYKLFTPFKNNWKLMQFYSFNYDLDLVGDIYFQQNYSNYRISSNIHLFNYLSSQIIAKNSIYIAFDFSLLLDQDEEIRYERNWVASSLKFCYRPFQKTGFGVFAQIYYGEDYYNVYVSRGPISFFRMGFITMPINHGIF